MPGKPRLMNKLRKQPYFDAMVRELAELGIDDWEVVPPSGRGHAILVFAGESGRHRMPLPGSAGPSSKTYVPVQIRRLARGVTSR